jgi:hypothetical protein
MRDMTEQDSISERNAEQLKISLLNNHEIYLKVWWMDEECKSEWLDGYLDGGIRMMRAMHKHGLPIGQIAEICDYSVEDVTRICIG